jgi:hypothetical protein
MSSNPEKDGLVGLQNAVVVHDDNYEIMFEGKTYRSYEDYVEAKRSRTAGIFADSGMLAARLAIAKEMTAPGPRRVKNPHGDVAIPPLLPRRKSSGRIVSEGIDLAVMMQEEDDVDVDANGDDDNNDDGSDNDDDDDEDDDDNDVSGMSEYELKRMQNMARNNARLASLGLLVPMTSTATLSSNPSNGKKRSASQDNVERRVQPKRNAKQPTSYRDFNDDNDDDGDELDSDTIDLVLLSDEDDDLDDDDDDSHDKLDIDTNDSDLQSNEDGEEALVNSDDLKPSARCTVLPPPPHAFA